ncbi:MAG: hypothetical protein R3E91_04795 [Chlamydiales bacterium]
MSAISDCFGFYPSNTYYLSSSWRLLYRLQPGIFHIQAFNFVRFLGYLPIFSILAGISKFRTLNALNQRDVSLSFRCISVIRGVLEILQLGLLFLIPDLIVTLGRYLSYRNQAQGNYPRSAS